MTRPVATTAPEPWSRVRCQTCGAPQLLTERCDCKEEGAER